MKKGLVVFSVLCFLILGWYGCKPDDIITPDVPLTAEKVGYSIITANLAESGNWDAKECFKSFSENKINITRVFCLLPRCLDGSGNQWRVMPWKVVDVVNDQRIWDLNQLEPLHFKRIVNLLKLAKKYGIHVIVSVYDNWAIRSEFEYHPFNRDNNVNNIWAREGSWEYQYSNDPERMKDYMYKYLERLMQETKEYADYMILEVGNETEESNAWHAEVVSWIQHINEVHGTHIKVIINKCNDESIWVGNEYCSIHGADLKKVKERAANNIWCDDDGMDSDDRYNSDLLYERAREALRLGSIYVHHSTRDDLLPVEIAQPNPDIMKALMMAVEDYE